MLYILIGVSGSGKSTLAKTISESICEADSFPGLYQNGVLQPELLGEAHSSCQKKVEEFMLQWTPKIVVSNTNLDTRSIRTYLDLAIKYSYRVQLCLPKYDLVHFPFERDRASQFDHLTNVRQKGDKIVPVHVLQKMIVAYDSLEQKIRPFESVTDPVKWKLVL
jgi:adenylate kinase family enzyme